MSFQSTHGPPSTRTQNESSSFVGAMTRPHSLYVPAADTVNGITDEPSAGGADLLLLPAATAMYRPPEAVLSLPICIGAVTVPLSASAVTVSVSAGAQDAVEPDALIRGVPLFDTQYPVTDWNPRSNGLPLPRATVKWSNVRLLPPLAMTAGRPSSAAKRTELLVNVMLF